MRMVTDKEDTVTATLSDKPPPTVYASLLMPTEEQKSSALHVLQVFFYVLFVIAVPLTLCNIIVFCQKEMRGATSVYVIGLSVAQLIYIIAYVILLILQETLASYSTSYVYWVYFMAATVYLSSVVRRASYVVMCVVSMERLYAVVRPLHIQDFFLSKYPVLSLSAVYIGTAVWHVYIIARSVVVGVKDERFY
nr:hypothetical protein BaRGS_004621 [Batillaria attramentaria]